MDSPWKDVQALYDVAGHVAKYIFTGPTAAAEAVLYRYPDYKTRTVICCSTQSGCPIGCRFCGSGDYFVRSLSGPEIVAQVEHCLQEIDCSAEEVNLLQIMFMSMGEPMLNPGGTAAAIRELAARYPRAALLVSTSAPRVDYESFLVLSCDVPTVGLQFSVHESTDAARNALIPFRAKLSLAEIAALGTTWAARTGRPPFFNYYAHEANSSPADADRLGQLFAPAIWRATVSVVCERSEGLSSTNEHQRGLARDFASLLVERGYDVRTFDPAGQDTIGGGCGQLHYVQAWFAAHPELARPSIGAGLRILHTPLP